MKGVWVAATLLGVGLAAGGYGWLSPESQESARRDGGSETLAWGHEQLVDAGRKIYTEGIGIGGAPISMTIAIPGMQAEAQSAELSSCVNCHGADGTSRVEGGIQVPAIRAQDLAMPYEGANSTGRVHRAYDDALIKRAVTMGIDASGNPLHSLMPRFQMSPRDLDALVAYLKELGHESDPGIRADALLVGVPLESWPVTQRSAVRNVIIAYFGELNANGGIYGRQVKVRFENVDPAECLCVIDRDSHEARYLDTETPVHLVPGGGNSRVTTESIRRNVFRLLPTEEVLLRVAVDHLFDVLRLGDSNVLLVQGGNRSTAIATAVGEQVGRHFGGRFAEISDGPQTLSEIERLSRDQPCVILLRGSARLPEWISPVAALGNVRQIYVGSIVAGLDGLEPVTLSKLACVSSIPVPESGDSGLQVLIEFLQRHEMESGEILAKTLAYGTCQIVDQALRKCGRRLSRDRYVRSLERLRRFTPSGLAPVTYHPQRRHGAFGGQVVEWGAAEQRWTPLSAWTEPKG